MTADATYWQERLDELAAASQVPGASLAILHDGELTAVATGVVNQETAVGTTPGTLFQIGSITKVWTSVLVMQLTEQGRLDLDAPLAQVLPELVLAQPGATGQITVRHLLNHSSGIDGDMFDDTGRGDDAVGRYVARCRRLALLHPAGATMSYCNSGFVIAGRIIETISGATWDDVLRRDLIEPLGLTSTVSLPEDALRFRAAYGHVGADGSQRLAPGLLPTRGAGPAGGIMATASDVIAFARLHLDRGRSGDGRQVLSEASVTAMGQPEVPLPPGDPAGGRHKGLGWSLYSWDSRQVLGHDGGTLGQYAFLRLLPDERGAVCLLTNGGQAQRLYRDLFTDIFRELWAVTIPGPLQPAPHAQPVDPARYAGRYERESMRIEVGADGAGLSMTTTDTSPFAAALADPVERLALTPVREDLFVTRASAAALWQPVVFYQLPGGNSYVHAGGRATPRRP
ncbi:MAG TPA: serine hydrolase domain-containing protein [Streptosporangiaceae bacterium]|nr:serine hydrolase domain-containing protein [Streptosporangiaceae bacterium]